MYFRNATRVDRPMVVAAKARQARRARALAIATAALLGGAGALLAQDPAQDALPYDYDAALAQSGFEGEYGYVRALDGSARLVQADGERLDVEVNEPVLVGDRFFVSGGARAELVLADRSIVRLGERAELEFRALANSADAQAAASVLALSRGTMQLVVEGELIASEYPSVLTPNASVEIRGAGSYLIVVDDEAYTEVVVREGRADVYTEDDGAEVRPGESVFVQGEAGRPTRLEFAAAPSRDRLEAWGAGLSDYDTGRYAEYVDDDLHYSAAGLRDHGSWVYVSGSYAWRPYVSTGWAPYRHGRWRYTPSGLFWVSYESWGWVPYHYGYWDYAPTYGWVWFPGRRFAPAHVYWYWGDGYAGWIPTGYYARHYGRYYGRSFGFHFGVYGYVGGGYYDRYRYWSFCPTGRLGHRRQYTYVLQGHDLNRRGVRLGRGILTTDTRALRPDVWRRPAEGVARLTRAAGRDGRSLTDASAFVERSPRLPAELERVTLRGGERGARTAAGGALRTGDRGAGEGRAPNVDSRARSIDGRTPRLDTRSATGRAGDRPTTLRRSDDAGVRSPTTRGRDTNLRRPGSSGSDPAVRARPTTRRPSADRPTTRRPSTGLPTTRRPSADRPTLDRTGRTTRPSTVRPPTRSRAGESTELRRPRTPVTGRRVPSRAGTGSRVEPRSAPATRRPSVRSSGSSSRSRPSARRSGAGSRSRPSARRSGSGSRSRPSARGSSGSRSRPAVRSGSSSRNRPTVRGSSGSRSRPAVRSGSSSRNRPAVRGSSGSRSRPAVRSGSSSRNRPTVRSRGSSSRGAGNRSRRSGGG